MTQSALTVDFRAALSYGPLQHTKRLPKLEPQTLPTLSILDKDEAETHLSPRILELQRAIRQQLRRADLQLRPSLRVGTGIHNEKEEAGMSDAESLHVLEAATAATAARRQLARKKDRESLAILEWWSRQTWTGLREIMTTPSPSRTLWDGRIGGKMSSSWSPRSFEGEEGHAEGANEFEDFLARSGGSRRSVTGFRPVRNAFSAILAGGGRSETVAGSGETEEAFEYVEVCDDMDGDDYEEEREAESPTSFIKSLPKIERSEGWLAAMRGRRGKDKEEENKQEERERDGEWLTVEGNSSPLSDPVKSWYRGLFAS